MLNLDTRIPLMAQERDYGRGFDTMQQAQENQLRLQALRDEYNAAKEERDRQKAIRQGMASELQKIQQGTPAQYRTTFPQTMPTGQAFVDAKATGRQGRLDIMRAVVHHPRRNLLFELQKRPKGPPPRHGREPGHQARIEGMITQFTDGGRINHGRAVG